MIFFMQFLAAIMFSINLIAVVLPSREQLIEKITGLENEYASKYIFPPQEKMLEMSMKFIVYEKIYELEESEVNYKVIVDILADNLDSTLPRIGCWCCTSYLYRRINIEDSKYIEKLFLILFEDDEKQLALDYWDECYKLITSKPHQKSCIIL